MDLNKAIRKQKKSYTRFLLSMCFIFLLLPLILFMSKKITIFFLTYLSIIEILIMVAVILRVSYEGLKFHYDEYKLKIKSGFFGEEINIICDKVALVHTEEQLDKLEIIIITTSRFRNKKIKAINSEFLRKYPYVTYHYYRIKKQFPESSYYYIIITKGGYHKYELLNKIFVSCVYGFFTEEAIDTIKKYRI
jgi:signal transduction histidine kinase